MPRFRKLAALFLFLTLLSPTAAQAIEPAPPLSDREIIERLTRVETKLDANTAAIAQLREDMNTQIAQLREDMNTQIAQLREDMNAQFGRIEAQFDRLYNLMLGIVGAFVVLVVATIGFALWDRRTMLRPVEDRIKTVEDEQARDRERLDALLEVFRALGQGDERVAGVLRQFRLL